MAIQTYRLFQNLNTLVRESTDTTDLALGLEFQVSVAATVTAVYFWMSSVYNFTLNVGIYPASSNLTPALLASELNVLGYQPGWNRFPLSNPVLLSPSPAKYKAVVQASQDGFYSAISGYFGVGGAGAAGVTNGILSAPNSANSQQGQGSYYEFASSLAYPNQTFNSTNYGIDVEVQTGVADSAPILLSTGNRLLTQAGAPLWT